MRIYITEEQLGRLALLEAVTTNGYWYAYKIRRGSMSRARGWVVDRIPMANLNWNDYSTRQYIILHNAANDDVRRAHLVTPFTRQELNSGVQSYCRDGSNGQNIGWNGYILDINNPEVNQYWSQWNQGQQPNQPPQNPQNPNNGRGQRGQNYNNGYYGGRDRKGMMRSFLDNTLDTIDNATWKHTWTGRALSDAWNSALQSAADYYHGR